MKNTLVVNVKTFAINALMILLYYVILLLVC
jgi:hypothetical protein